MSYDSDNLDRIVNVLRDELDVGDWSVYTARRISNATGCTSNEVGYWLSRINGSRDDYEPLSIDGLEISKWKTGASTPVRWKVERVPDSTDATSDSKIIADGGVRWLDLSEVEQQIVKAVIEIENEVGDDPYGVAIKHILEERYGREISNATVYPNLDDLVEMGVIEKGEIDRRTNAYHSTPLARSMVAGEAEHMASLAGLELAEAVADGGETQ
ncbi:DNA-binding protein [Haloferax sp. Atlit-12N]|uniref:helix-turn-helix transcriptional regulator n=1 Tax=Haloferax sp. Atlit-12N TaxID=2077203 RepID=UPI000E23A72A|nr:helix-turn-helix transcriptional regulator [Haloferax sp. Atlit-12N]RDZ65987.1 DNA-binding protein [Haloferax sp. Atlit-12N]